VEAAFSPGVYRCKISSIKASIESCDNASGKICACRMEILRINVEIKGNKYNKMKKKNSEFIILENLLASVFDVRTL
jgi:hypothetical protein